MKRFLPNNHDKSSNSYFSDLSYEFPQPRCQNGHIHLVWSLEGHLSILKVMHQNKDGKSVQSCNGCGKMCFVQFHFPSSTTVCNHYPPRLPPQLCALTSLILCNHYPPRLPPRHHLQYLISR